MMRKTAIGFCFLFLVSTLALIVRSQTPSGGYTSPAFGGSTSSGSVATACGGTANAVLKLDGTGVNCVASSATDNGTTFASTEPIQGTRLISTIATGTAPLTVTSTTNVANLNAASLNGTTFAAPGPIGGSSPSSVNWSSLLNQTHMLCTGANPTISVGTGATIATGNGSCSFTVNVGTGGLSSITLAFSGTSVQSGWICMANDRTTHSATVFQTVQTNSALSTTTAVIQNLTNAGALGTAWTNSDLISLQCAAD